MSAHPSRKDRYKFALLSALAVGGLLFWSWQQWVSLIVDAGQNFYTFWQMSEGKRLYRDLSYFHGPLSPWIESLFFRFFGVSIQTLALTGAALVWLIANLIYFFFDRVFDHATALAASLFFLFVFAFSQYVMIENYNYLAPYKFEAAHGILFGLLFFVFALRLLKTGSPRFFFALGLCLGCSLLTATEVVFANFSAFCAFFLLAGGRLARLKASIGWLLAGLFLPVALAWLALSTYLPPAEALTHLFSALTVPLKQPGIAQNTFYRNSMGLDNWQQHLQDQAWAVLVAATLAGMLALVDRGTRRLSRALNLGGGIAFAALALIAAFSYPPAWAMFWNFPRILPFTGIAAFMLYVWKCRHAPLSDKSLLTITWAVWSLALLAKIILFPRIFHYGFYLALPASLLLIVLANHVLPQRLKAAWDGGAFFRAATFGLVFVAGAVYFQQSQRIYSQKTFRIGYGGDAIATWSPQIAPIQGVNWLALDWIEKNVPPDATLLTLPEGSIFNYLSRRRRPGPYTLNVVEMLSAGESRILEAWKRSPPDYVALIQNDSKEFGLPPFGSSAIYGKATMDWVRANYNEVKLIGHPPFRSVNINDYGIMFLKRR